jgi:two-component system response regulator (stage 0 sporulation protein F)
MDAAMSKVLIVDDDDGIRYVLRELLAEEGFQVRTACDGQEALEVLQREGGWVILLDMRMPNTDGPAVLRELERNRRLRGTNSVAVMSAGWGLTQQRPHLQPGLVRAILSKPFELDTVLDVVTRLAS